MIVDKANESLLLSQALVHADVRERILSIPPEEFLSLPGKQLRWLVEQIATRKVREDLNSYWVLAQQFPGTSVMERQDLEWYMEFGREANPNLEEHIHALKQDFARWTISGKGIEELQKIMEKGSIPLEDAKKVLAEMGAQIDSVEEMSNLKLLDLAEWMKRYGDFAAKRLAGTALYRTGFSELDTYLTEGLAPEKISLIAGRPGMGKSTFALCMATRLSHLKVPVAVFSLEMNAVSLIDKLVAGQTQIDLGRLFRGELTARDKKALEWTQQQLSQNKFLYLDDTPRCTLQRIASQVIQLQRKIGQRYMVVVIDLFGKLADINDGDGDSLTPKYERALHSIQILARDLGVHFSLVAQIGRKVEVGKDPMKWRPSLSSLKHCGAFEEVADLVLFMFRPKYYLESEPEDELEVCVGKQRMGRQNVIVTFQFDGARSMISEKDVLGRREGSEEGCDDTEFENEDAVAGENSAVSVGTP